jgi:hypothetical protein
VSREGEVNVIKYILRTMEPLKGHPERERFCVNFDGEYERLKAVYKALTGAEWEGDGE